MICWTSNISLYTSHARVKLVLPSLPPLPPSLAPTRTLATFSFLCVPFFAVSVFVQRSLLHDTHIHHRNQVSTDSLDRRVRQPLRSQGLSSGPHDSRSQTFGTGWKYDRKIRLDALLKALVTPRCLGFIH
jgi:hypothetical protein